MQRAYLPSLASSLLALLLLKTALAVAGFGRTWRWMQRNAERHPLMRESDDAFVAQAEYTVAMAAALYPGRAACLERSMLLYWYLRRAGVAVRFRVGAQLYPFLAHAWVEYQGRPINDVPEHVQLFQPMEGTAI